MSLGDLCFYLGIYHEGGLRVTVASFSREALMLLFH